MFATSHPNQFLVVGRNGKVVNRGTGIRVFLWPGSTYVLLPSTKQETFFEMTQETKDGIPMHFKGIVIYKISDPVQAAMSFNFSDDTGLQEINTMINDICRGELRSAVSVMTMNECIEQRKTVLTSAVDKAVRETVSEQGGWGIELEVVQVAQVFIMDNTLRKQLEAEVRNEIRLKSDQSDLHTQEMVKLAQIASEQQLLERRMHLDKEGIRQQEELKLANLQVERRMRKQAQEAENEAIQLGLDTFKLNEKAAQEKAEIETPVRLLQLEKQQQILERELEIRRVELRVRELEVQRDMVEERASQEMRKEMLPIEQAPQIANALSGVFKDANLSVWGDDNQIFASIVPLMNVLAQTVKEALTKQGGQNVEKPQE